MANETKLANIINPQVMQDMVSAGLPKALKFTQFAAVNEELKGVPGDTVTIPAWAYIGAAEDVAEGAEVTTATMSASTKTVQIKTAGKAITLTDKAVNSGLGDPVGQATYQLSLSMADKMDNDVLTALGTTTLTVTDTKQISYKGIVAAIDKLNEETATEKVLFVAPSQVTVLRQDDSFIAKDKYGNDVMMNGEIGMIAGCRVVPSRRIDDTKANIDNFIVCLTPEVEDGTPALPAVTIYTKADVMLETERHAKALSTDIVASAHYAVGLTNESKVVKATFKK
ncbi:N4-gp56 family major capsid protein [Veillonella sp.]|uniref:N4-gp56 family major capsid protein n=1 Tax=Veillonella sp. TaxID=1926307 RepID=UPI00258027C5|nr:N4-gp56 family major capsid protein [Veillonella sp.]MBS6121524.1 N4-gp56 family major capsid protein [Veillonella sp.]